MFTLLIVDDEEFERSGVRFLIDKYKLELETAEADSGEKALEYVRRHPIDILLTDIRMKEMDGLMLAEKVRELQPVAKIIFLSAFGEFEYAQKAIDLHAIHYILKPVEVNDFLKVLTLAIQMCKEDRKQLERNLLLQDVYKKAEQHQFLFDLLYGDSRSVDEESGTALTAAPVKETIVPEDSGQAIQEIANFVERGEFEPAKRRFGRLLDELRDNGSYSAIYVKYICSEILRSLFDSTNKRDAVFFNKCLESIYKTAGLEELEPIMTAIFDYYAEQQAQVPGVSESVNKVVEDVMHIIESEYRTDLSVEGIAERVYLSPSYLSHLFAKQKGVSIIKHLTLFRLEKAKKLLQETNMKIIDVGKQVGYSNYPYFCTLLKNHFGMTPSQIREEGRP